MSIEKVGFVISVALLGVIYGILANQWGLFPAPFARQAWNQAEVVLGVRSPDPRGGPVYEQKKIQVVRPDQMQPGLTLVTFFREEGSQDAQVQLIDREGRVLHKWNINKEEIFREESYGRKDLEQAQVHGSHLLSGGDIVINVRYVGLARLNSCSEVTWVFNEGTHHSVAQAENGTFWVPAVHSERRTKSSLYNEGYPGLKKKVWVERILNISDDGDILKDINLLDVVYENNLERHIAKSKMIGSEDPLHLNDVEPLSSEMADQYPLFEAGDLLVSLRNLDLVAVFSPDTKNVKWHASHPFIWQHDPDFMGDGWIGVFDNNKDGTARGTMLGGSRIVAIQPHTDSTAVRFPTSDSDPFYSPIRGKWQLLENGNMLLSESEAGRVVEVNSFGRTVWEWIKPYQVVTEASRHDLTREEVASWSCSSVDSARASVQKLPPQNQQSAR